VKDEDGNPVSGVTVTFTPPDRGASGTFAGGVHTATTNASGVATSAVFAANATAGSYTITARVAGVSKQTDFTLTNTKADGGPTTALVLSPDVTAERTNVGRTIAASN